MLEAPWRKVVGRHRDGLHHASDVIGVNGRQEAVRALAGHGYCRLAVGRDHLDACPVRMAGGEAVTRTLTRVSIQTH